MLQIVPRLWRPRGDFELNLHAVAVPYPADGNRSVSSAGYVACDLNSGRVVFYVQRLPPSHLRPIAWIIRPLGVPAARDGLKALVRDSVDYVELEDDVE